MTAIRWTLLAVWTLVALLIVEDDTALRATVEGNQMGVVAPR